MADADREAYLATLSPGVDIDHRGTPCTEELLNRLLAPLRDPATGHPRLGTARFDSATFQSDIWFEAATFERDAEFVRAVFEQSATLGPLVCVPGE